MARQGTCDGGVVAGCVAPRYQGLVDQLPILQHLVQAGQASGKKEGGWVLAGVRDADGSDFCRQGGKGQWTHKRSSKARYYPRARAGEGVGMSASQGGIPNHAGSYSKALLLTVHGLRASNGTGSFLQCGRHSSVLPACHLVPWRPCLLAAHIPHHHCPTGCAHSQVGASRAAADCGDLAKLWQHAQRRWAATCIRINKARTQPSVLKPVHKPSAPS